MKTYTQKTITLVGMLLATIFLVTGLCAATYPPLTCNVGQHIDFAVNPVDASGKPVVLDFSTRTVWTFAPAGIITTSAGTGNVAAVVNCLAVGTSIATLSITNNGASNTTLSESFQVTVNPPPPAVTFGFVFQPPM